MKLILSFNLDRDRLEGELRKFSCMACIEGAKTKNANVYSLLEKTFGTAFVHKLGMIEEERG